MITHNTDPTAESLPAVSDVANSTLTDSTVKNPPITISWQNNTGLVLAAITLVALLIGWLGKDVIPGWAILIAALTAFAAGGYSGFIGAIEAARERRLDIDFLMIVAALGAAAIGEWEEGALLLFLFTLSSALEEFAMERTRNAISALADLRPDMARVHRDGDEVMVAVEELQLGDEILVKPGERIPADGVIKEGQTAVDQSAITGESMPAEKALGDIIYAGSINGQGAFTLVVDKLTSETTLNKIIQLVSEAQEDTVPTQQFIDRFGQPYTYVVLAMTALAIVIPWSFANEPFQQTFYRAMTLLVVASPCALFISTPASILSAIASAARGGVLFKGGAYLERLAQVTAIAFDKTGTLTQGKHVVTDLHALAPYSKADLLQMAASAELLSEHHLAKPILARAKADELTTQRPVSFEAVAGHGVVANFRRDYGMATGTAIGAISGIISAGNEKLFAHQSIPVPAEIRAIGASLQAQGKTAIAVAHQTEQSSDPGLDWQFVGFVALADTVRPEAANAIAALRDQGMQEIVMITGDNQAVAQNIAEQLQIDTIHSDVLPEQKVEIVQQLSQNRKTVMVGDGVNDAPALARASVGVAMGAGGTDVALETAGVVLMASKLDRLPFALRLSRQAARIVRQNVIFSIGVMILLVLITVGLPLLIPGFALPLPLGVVGHEGSTLLVVANGLRLLAMQPDAE